MRVDFLAAMAVVAMWVALAGVARAKPVRVVIGDGVPFSPAQLTEAIAARAVVPAGTEVRVDGAGDGAVSVAVGQRRRRVVLGPRRGVAAARQVALAAADLLIPLAAPEMAPAAARAAPKPSAEAKAERPVARTAAPMPPAVTVEEEAPPKPVHYAAMSHILAGDAEGASPLTAVSMEIGVPVGASFLAGFELGVAAAVDTDGFPGERAMIAVPVRLGMGRRYGDGMFAWRTSAIAIPYKIRHCGQTLYSGAKLGLGATARVLLPVGDHLSTVIGFGIDAFLPSFESYQTCTKSIGGGVTYALPALPTYADAGVGARVGVGIAWGAAR